MTAKIKRPGYPPHARSGNINLEWRRSDALSHEESMVHKFLNEWTEVDTQDLLERYIEIITPEVRSIGTNWEYIYIFSAVFDGNVADFTTGITPGSENKLGWFSRESRSALSDLLMKWQRGLSGAGAKSFASIVRVDRKNVETRFFYGDDAEEWEVTREWQHLMDKAQKLFP